MNGKLLVMIGGSNSGKSFYLTKWLKEIDNHNKVIVNSDMVRLALTGKRFYQPAEPQVHATTFTMVKVLYMSGFFCAVDETNTTKSSICRWLEMDNNAEFIWTNTPKEICKIRASGKGHDDLFPIIDRHYKNIEKLANYGGAPSYLSLYKRLDASIALLRTEASPDSWYIPLVEIKSDMS